MVAPLNTIPLQTRQYSNNTPVAITDNATFTSTIVVSGADPFLLDFNLRTFLAHTFAGGLDITITSPSGTVVTLTTGNGAGSDDVFNGTLWDDGANPLGQVPYVTNNGLATDHAYVNNVLASQLVPEEAFGAFVGENPNGTWTISIRDDGMGDTGSLNSWAIDLTATSAAPTTQSQTFTNNVPVAVPTSPGVVTSQILVSGASSNVFDLNLQTNLLHTFPQDLDVTLTSPQGTVVTLTTDNGGNRDNVFNGTVWNDDGVVAATDHEYVDLTTAPSLIPEEALAAFMGEDPNGIWTLTISDDLAGDGGSLDSWSLTVNSYADEPVVTGTPGDDTFTPLPGNQRIDALGGIDTATFDFRLVDATVTYRDNRVIIDGPSSHTVLTGVERFVFTDGTVDNADSNALVDDLFYYSRYHDVWNAHVDADVHYNASGWNESRDPNAFFDASMYVSIHHPGGNPLDQYHATGWKNGNLPSLDFDGAAYLAANPDVAAAQIDPLAHFLQFGAAEGRQPFAPTELLAGNGFDYVYYLSNNPDVAAANVDPLLHFQNVGWHEGRNPNAFFDTAGYLSHYTDVAAAGVNPLDHYHLAGWKEGRDPSVGFDTIAYVSNNFFVAVANVNPLNHYLQYGIHEGRSAFADGVWG
jgi:subtilisin-like proprotein convertase family protein